MMSNSEYLSIRFEVDVDGETKHLEIANLSLLPSVGDEVACDYVHGMKIRSEVQGVKHHLSSIGQEILQQITIYGKAF